MVEEVLESAYDYESVYLDPLFEEDMKLLNVDEGFYYSISDPKETPLPLKAVNAEAYG